MLLPMCVNRIGTPRMSARLGAACLGLLGLFAPSLAPAAERTGEAPPLERSIAAVDRLAAAELAKQDIGGCTVGIVVGPRLVWAKSYGLADIEKRIEATNEHVYRIGSITKQFTGLVLLQLVEDGVVNLSDPVTNHFPEFVRVENSFSNAPPATLGQLATMTSGLAREPRNLRRYLKGPVAEWENVLMSALPDTRFAHEPDTRYHYSNIGYAILGAALGRASEGTFVDHTRSRILEPLGMTHTAFEPNAAIRSRIAKGYALANGRPDGTFPAAQHAGRGYKVPNGALYTTVSDLARFISFQLGYGPESVLPRKSVKANFARVNSTNADLSSGYGVGFSMVRRDDLVFVGHGGSVAGYNAAAFLHRPTETGVIVLRNVGGGRFNAKRLCHASLEIVARGNASPR